MLESDGEPEWPSARPGPGITNLKTAIIVGAGPAGLTAAYELLNRSDIVPTIIEKSGYMGGLARTVNYKGNRIDAGGHRFFSKSDRVMDWWLQHLPLDSHAESGQTITYHNQQREISSASRAPGNDDDVMLLRRRKSRIHFQGKFFDYPLTLGLATLRTLGVLSTLKIGLSYLYASLSPPRPIVTLEDFFISRFGRELYRTFFQSYTEKVWGVSCRQISAEWGVQRVKGLSAGKAVQHFFKSALRLPGVRQRATETSLVERFLYPKFGPGQLWEVVARKVEALGGRIRTGLDFTGLQTQGDRVMSLSAQDASGRRYTFNGDYFFSTMPMSELTAGLDCPVPENVSDVARGLVYRNFVIVGLLVRRLAVQDSKSADGLIQDNWIYLQDPGVQAGRLQIFNNWSPSLVRDPGTIWIGVEYFCDDGDRLWTLPDKEMANLAAAELAKIGILAESDVLDATVVRMDNAYPAYFGSYPRFSELREFLDRFRNLFLVGRNGMHKYNNQDHSMLTAMTAVDNIIAGREDKSNIWAVNTEMDYHEENQEI